MGGGGGASAVGVPVAFLAEEEGVGGASDGYRLAAAVVADLAAHVLAGERVRRVDDSVAGEAELGRVGSAEENGDRVTAELARERVPSSASSVSRRRRSVLLHIFFFPVRGVKVFRN